MRRVVDTARALTAALAEAVRALAIWRAAPCSEASSAMQSYSTRELRGGHKLGPDPCRSVGAFSFRARILALREAGYRVIMITPYVGSSLAQ